MTKKTIKKTAGIYLRNCRMIKGLSQRQLAQKLGYGNGQIISNVERGIAGPPLYIICKWAKEIEADPEKTMELVINDFENRVREACGLTK